MNYPIVFIPGLFGTLGDDVIKGTGKLSFGLAERVYRPFIEILNSMGYIEEENLFISYYDWKSRVLDSINRYLYPDIERIKRQTGYNKVIIIGHSLGGLLGRGYMTYFDPSSVEKLIMIGTPNFGAIDAYCFWGGGKLPYPKVEENVLYNGLKLGFILYYKFYHDMDYLKVLREMFPVAEDLLPSYEYGDYLYWEQDQIKEYVSINSMSIENAFLNKLNIRPVDLERLYIIAGSNTPTNMEFLIDVKDGGRGRWVDGKPIKIQKTNYGDGTVTTPSVLGNLGDNNIILKGNHIEILYKSQDYLSRILERPVTKEIEIEEVEKVQLILASDCEGLDIVTSDHNEISSKSINIVDDRIQAIDLGNNNFWIMAAGGKDLKIEMDTRNNKKIKAKIYNTTISV